jgi:hypothetical protein
MSELLQMVQRRRKPLLVETRVCPHCGRRADEPAAGVPPVTTSVTSVSLDEVATVEAALPEATAPLDVPAIESAVLPKAKAKSKP